MIQAPGFYIKVFEARGVEVETSRVEFDSGCNVVVGKSDTGKTTLFRLLEFVLGKSGEVKLSSEWEGYTAFYVELHTSDEEIYTLMRKHDESVVVVKKMCNQRFPFSDKRRYLQYINQCKSKYFRFLASII